MDILLLLFLLFGAAATVLAGFRWAARRIRRRLGLRTKAEQPLHMQWLDEALVGTAGSIFLPPVFYLLFFFFAARFWPHFSPRGFEDAALRLAFPVAIASIWLWIWGFTGLSSFHRSRKERHDHPKAALCTVLTLAWLLLFVPYALWVLFCWMMADF